MSWLDMLASLDSTKMTLSKMLETGKGLEAWSAAVRGVAELELACQLKIRKKLYFTYIKQEEIFEPEIWNSLHPFRKIRCFFMNYGRLSISFMKVCVDILLLILRKIQLLRNKI